MYSGITGERLNPSMQVGVKEVNVLIFLLQGLPLSGGRFFEELHYSSCIQDCNENLGRLDGQES